mmetsp:Transcript_13852/g.24266  ORF Transcript_13852/g.24266 Transcript_13852/m.24266 type:complete len:261 (+) Transcript_13852:31-813(+)|eukprot:CAMPEP_0119105400 /NCGR_PEP_ID=MMETSP1180-20130426/3372_1 /TAXON_ID=3052 ORGANISM="Chlamydomonas cf sp, Strain CCMP681" /NCGR_SAMPLE_ID=MMETSP1180 /ASSEMBLY_ACC=CAM_ASM_000741 /LENGTH=260 /DNA_ID=CAMNT_0007090439 /DNA_START=27 /DNA_END=809 /DNA_ORIENTATION=-
MADHAAAAPGPTSIPEPCHQHGAQDNFSIFGTPGAGHPPAVDQAPCHTDTIEVPAEQELDVQPESLAEVMPPDQGVEQLNEEETARRLAEAEAFKAEGNALYGQCKWEEAAGKYSDAVEAAPPSAANKRAVYLANLAACDMARKLFTEAVRACTAAVEEDPLYIKAYMRRGVAHRELDDLDHALGDAKKVLELEPGNSWAIHAVQELEPMVQQKNDKLKDEMLGKLKDLGNNLLGKFGMSLDSFKAEKDPATGSYSVKFG